MGILAIVLSMIYAAGDTLKYSDSVFRMFIYGYILNNLDYLFVISACMCFSDAFVKDYNSGNIKNILIRSNSPSYAFSKYISCVVTSGISVVLGIIIFLFIGMAIHGNMFPAHEVILNEYDFGGLFSLVSSGKYGLYFLFMFIQIFLRAAFWSGLALAVSAYMPNVYIVYGAPIIANGLLTQLAVGFKLPDWVNISLLGRGWMDFSSTSQAVIITWTMFTALILLNGFIFIRKIKWRIAND